MRGAAIALLALLPGVGGDALPDARRLKSGTDCFAIVRAGTVVGATRQTIRRSITGGRPTWDIVVHQRQNDGSFDMRDHFVVDRRSLLPLSMDSRRGVDRGAPGWHRIALRYADGRVTGGKQSAAGTSAIDVPLTGATWDGNLWGVTFAALPLTAGGRYELPTWQYDKGAGTFAVVVVGSQTVATPAGPVDAWAIDAGDDPAHPVRYLVAKGRPRELGYRARPFEQRLGGVCANMDIQQAR